MTFLGYFAVSLFHLSLHCVCAEPQSLDAVALYDFESRTGQELSFKKGDLLVLKRRISEDWWEGLHGNQLGLVPTKYVATDARRCERIFAII